VPGAASDSDEPGTSKQWKQCEYDVLQFSDAHDALCSQPPTSPSSVDRASKRSDGWKPAIEYDVLAWSSGGGDIPSAFEYRQSRHGHFTEYCVRCGAWNAWRRFSEFVSLHTQIAHNLGLAAAFPVLKVPTALHTDALRQYRSQALARYLMAVVAASGPTPPQIQQVLLNFLDGGRKTTMAAITQTAPEQTSTKDGTPRTMTSSSWESATSSLCSIGDFSPHRLPSRKEQQASGH
jgi:hypothetical protein